MTTTPPAAASTSVRERFNSHLAEYGTLWRALAASAASAKADASAHNSSKNSNNDVDPPAGKDAAADQDQSDEPPPDAILSRLVSKSPISSPTTMVAPSSSSFAFAALDDENKSISSPATSSDSDVDFPVSSPAQSHTGADNGLGNNEQLSTPADENSNHNDDDDEDDDDVPTPKPATMTKDEQQLPRQQPEFPSLLPAILGGKTVSLRVSPMAHDECDVMGCEGNCAEPIFENNNDVEEEHDDEAEENNVGQEKDARITNQYNDSSGVDSYSSGDGSAFDIDLSFLHSQKGAEAKPDIESNSNDEDAAAAAASTDSDHVSNNKEASSFSSGDESESTIVVMDMSHLVTPHKNVPKKEDSASSDNDHVSDDAASLSSSSVDDSDSTIVVMDMSHLVTPHKNVPKKEDIDDDYEGNEINNNTDSRDVSLQAGPSGVARANKESYDSDSTSAAASNDTSEEEWIEDGHEGGANGEESKVTFDKATKESSFEVIILSDDDEDEDDEDDEEDSEYADDSFVEKVSVGSNSDSDRSQSSSDDDDIQFIEKPRRKQKSPAPKPKPARKKKNEETQIESRSAFIKKRDHYTTSIFSEFNTKVFNGAISSVQVTWSKRLKTTAGLTRLKRIGTADRMRRIATVELSTKILDSVDRLRSTLLHELCHAAAWLVDGVYKPPHGKIFKKWANLSMRKIRDVEVTTTHDYVIQFKYAWKCTNTACGSIIKRHSRSVDPTRHWCGSCSKGKLIEIEVPGSKGDVATVGHTPKKKRAPTGFSLFVQQNSKAIRAKLVAERGASVTQPEVMKECGRVWREQKESKQKKSSKPSAQDENVPYDLNKAVNDTENRLKELSMM